MRYMGGQGVRSYIWGNFDEIRVWRTDFGAEVGFEEGEFGGGGRAVTLSEKCE